MYHVWLLSNIAAKTKDHLTDSQIYGLTPVQLINWLFENTEKSEKDDTPSSQIHKLKIEFM